MIEAESPVATEIQSIQPETAIHSEEQPLFRRIKNRIVDKIHEHTYQGRVEEYWQKHDGIIDYVTSATDLYTLQQKIHHDADAYAKGKITKDALIATVLVGTIIGGGIYTKNKGGIGNAIHDLPKDVIALKDKPKEWKVYIITLYNRFLHYSGNAIGDGIMDAIKVKASDISVDVGAKAGEAAGIGFLLSLPDWLLRIIKQ